MKILFTQKPVQSESASLIKQLVDTTATCLKALKNMGLQTDTWDMVTTYLVVSKLDSESIKLWEQQISATCNNDIPTWSELRDFLEARFRALEMIESTKVKTVQPKVIAKPKVFHSNVTSSDGKRPETKCAFEHIKSNSVLLATANVLVDNKNGFKYVVRALLDQGSQASFVTEATVQLLNLPRRSVSGWVSGVGERQTKIKHRVTLYIKSCHNPNASVRVEAYVLRSLTTMLPTTNLGIPEWSDLKDLELADPGFATPGRIDILLGADKMLRVISYCRRWLNVKLNKNKVKYNTKFITSQEINETLNNCIKQIQGIEFNQEIKQLKSQGSVLKRSKLRNLCPIIDDNGILRVGGRIQQSQVTDTIMLLELSIFPRY
ncbi:hypothetical protein SFRURICE_012866 [Spodoptera frugiperda]|nr:hypothetical protein SFRURICE_012866 [Spodoptera frugiperda]